MWSDFIALAQKDGEANDDRGGYARDMLAAMGHYMEARYGTGDVALLADLAADEAVTAAIAGNVSAIEAAEAAVTSAAAAVVSAQVQVVADLE